jgi:hypothetical protein
MRIFLILICLLVKVNCFADDFSLSLNSSEKYAITEIITAMGEKNLAKLLIDGLRLRRLGDSIEHVPPLQFLGFVLTNPSLKENLKKISKNTFKWSSFIDGLGANMEKELYQGRLIFQLEGFSKLVGGSVNQLEGYVYREEWEAFVKSLL